jgi:Alternative complex III, ActD subunit
MSRKPKLNVLFALYDDFDRARDVVADLKILDLKELVVEDIELYSPIEHPEVEEILGDISQPIQRFTFFGAITGAICGFLLVAAAAQAMFTVQPQGGKPVIPLPTDLVITYEFTILFGVWITLVGFLIYSGMPRRRLKKFYSQKVSEDQIGIEVSMKPENVEKVRETLLSSGALEIREV